MWKYLYVVIALWTFVPAIRRIYELYHGYSDVSVLSIVPLVSVIPFAIAILFGGRLRRLPFTFAAAVWCWIGSLAYGLALSFAGGNLAPGLYSFAQFALPMTVGIWIATNDIEPELAYKRLSSCILFVAIAASVYGVFQFVVVPPWDAYWLRHAPINSAGNPIPFQIRVFSTLNGPAVFGNFLVVALLMIVPRMSIRKPVYLLGAGICIIAFGLSLARSSWLGFAIGLFVYFIFTPSKMRLLSVLGGVSIVAFCLLAFLPAVTGDSKVGDLLSSRMETFTDLDHDRSAQDRRSLYSDAFESFTNAPMGQGLGTLGTASKLNTETSAVNFDSGVLARLIELGVPGCILYVIALGFGFWTSFAAWRVSEDRPEIASLVTISMAFQVALFGMLLSADSHNGFTAIIMWSLIGLSAKVVSKSARLPIASPYRRAA